MNSHIRSCGSPERRCLQYSALQARIDSSGCSPAVPPSSSISIELLLFVFCPARLRSRGPVILKSCHIGAALLRVRLERHCRCKSVNRIAFDPVAIRDVGESTTCHSIAFAKAPSRSRQSPPVCDRLVPFKHVSQVSKITQVSEALPFAIAQGLSWVAL